MQPEEIRRLIEEGMPGAEVRVAGDGRHFEAIVVSEDFDGLTPIKRHRRVYETLGDRFHDETLHALSLKTYTPAQWANLHG